MAAKQLERPFAADITPEQVREIRRLRAEEGLTLKVLGERFGIGQSQVSRIIHRQSWAHLD